MFSRSFQVHLTGLPGGIECAFTTDSAVVLSRRTVVNKILLSCLCSATILFPDGSARAQDQTIVLPDLPVAVEPDHTQNLMLFSAGQDSPQSVRTEVAQEQAKAVQQTEADSERGRRQEELRKKIYAYGPPYRGRVDIWLRNNRKLTGTIVEISSGSFLLQQKKNKRVTVFYGEVTRGPVPKFTASTEASGEAVAWALVLAMWVTGHVLAYNASHR
jgi:hypothetical protein